MHYILQCILTDIYAILLVIQGGEIMSFQLKANKKESENKTIRFPIYLIDKIETAIQNQDVTFSSFVLQACEYALDNMDSTNDAKN
jgi:hypothetical protein